MLPFISILLLLLLHHLPLLSMALKISHLLIALLWLSLILLLPHRFNNVKPFIINYHEQRTSTMRYPSLFPHQVSINRKALSSKFDFTPFQKPHHRLQNHGEGASDERAKSEIDPRYGVEKRLVPTGPNPLHHWWISLGLKVVRVRIWFIWWFYFQRGFQILWIPAFVHVLISICNILYIIVYTIQFWAFTEMNCDHK